MAVEWFLRIDDQVHGPMSAAELRQKASAGLITLNTPIRKGVEGRWVRAEKVKGLFLPSASPPSVAASHVPEESVVSVSASAVERERQSPPSTLPLAVPSVPKPGKSLPYGLIIAWGWTVLIGAFLLFKCDFGRYGLAALYPENLLIIGARLFVPVVLLVIPTLQVAVHGWRISKSPRDRLLLGVNAMIILLLIAKACRPPEPLPYSGSSSTSTNRKELKQLIDRLESHNLKAAERPSVQPEGGVRRDDQTERGVEYHGAVADVEGIFTKAMNDVEEFQNEYQRKLRSISRSDFFEPSRLSGDRNLAESRAMLRNAKELIAQYRPRFAAIMNATRSRITNAKFDWNTKQGAIQAFDRNVKSTQPKVDRIWDLEENTVDELDKLLSLLGSKLGSWRRVNGKIVFQEDREAQECEGILSKIQRYAAEEEKIKGELVDDAKAGFARMKSEF